MRGLQKILYAYQVDRSLQIATVVLVLLFISFWQKQARLEEMRETKLTYEEVARNLASMDLGAQPYQGGSLTGDPFLIELPAPRDVAEDAMMALLSGQSVLIKDETGTMRVMHPPRGPDGQVRDHSETLHKLAEILCLENVTPEQREVLSRLSEENLQAFCRLTAD